MERVIENRNLRIEVVMSSAIGILFEGDTYTSSDNKEDAEHRSNNANCKVK